MIVTIAALGLAATIAGRSVQLAAAESAPELDSITAVIAGSLAAEIDTALALGIPLPDLTGVVPWFDDVIAANPAVVGLAIADPDGRIRHASSFSADMVAALAASPRNGHRAIGKLRVGTVSLGAGRQASQTRDTRPPAGWLHVVAQTQAPGWQAFALPTALAGGVALAAGLWLHGMMRRRLLAPLRQIQSALQALADGRLVEIQRLPAAGAVRSLQRELARYVERTVERDRQALLRVAEVRAAHFEPAILARLDALAAPIEARQPPPRCASETTSVGRGQPLPIERQLALAAAFAMLAVGLGTALALRPAGQSTQRELLRSHEQLLAQAWRSTLEAQRPILEAALAAPTALRLSLDGAPLDQALEGTEADLPQAAALAPLRAGASEIDGVWQARDFEYRRALARRSPHTSPDEPALTVVSMPISESLTALGARLDAPVALVDLRGEPVFDPVGLASVWRTGGRSSRLDAESVLATLPLNDAGGRLLGTLLVQRPRDDAGMHATEFAALLTGSGLALAAAFGLLAWLPTRLSPLSVNASRLARLASRDPAHTRRVGLDAAGLASDVARLEDMLASLALLRRSRDRQGRRQARFIRKQMLALAGRVGGEARAGILAELERIEASEATATDTGKATGHDARGDELGIIALGFRNLVDRVGDQYQELDRLVAELREALRVKTRFIAIQQELEIASRMQQAILPRDFAIDPRLEISARMLPAKEIGGDFFDLFRIDEHRIALTVADVSGKGVPAALFMAVSRTLLRAVAQTVASPGECLARLNDLLSSDNEQTMFVTMFYAVIDVRDGTLVMANAGHDPPLLIRADDGRVEPLHKTQGMALAVFDGNVYEECRLQLAPGERLFLYTDGVTEAFDPQRTLFGTERLVELLRGLRAYSVDAIPEEVIAAVKRFEADGPQSDDITCMTIAWRGVR